MAMLVILFITIIITTATVSRIRRNRRGRRPTPGDVPVNWWSPSGRDGHHGGWSGGGDGSVGGHHG
jgi:hypothetical protein